MIFLQNHETPLHIAARTRDGEKCAEMLLKSGANVNARREVRIYILFAVHRKNGLDRFYVCYRQGQ